ncbi:DMT family transporter [Parvularcula flava]|uniref:DMT family transporter n=1 Tax=Aquisalinus luteolus TaxID=1566827 RepID=A0A8J3A5T0_9PROT|nr:DMT family transporter [Aquisalinus luteolus]NHK26887.1 DMT family transporter [Aquisalinus luteolus]GGH93716.1 hypothetical protein GCM10011355_06210 [Aquisalinus luteolus]
MTRILALTIVAMIAFAANSVFARLALIDSGAGAAIGPVAYTVIRLVSGAAVLAGLAMWRFRLNPLRHGSWTGGASLAAYAGLFSLAYVVLGAGLGALILFACVQMTMIGWGVFRGERLAPVQLIGLAVAVSALLWLIAPGAGNASLSALPAMLAMALSGVAWGVYSLIGRGARQPTAQTAGNFLRACIITVLPAIALLPMMPEPMPAFAGIAYATLSGAIASGLGYAVWYAALPGLKATQAGIAQLSVPAIAAAGGVIFLSEPLTVRFTIASLLILSGVALATLTKRRT